MFEYIPKFNDLTEVVYDDYRNNEEREFLTVLYSYVSTSGNYNFEDHNFYIFYDGDTMTVAFDVVDEFENHVLRSLRVDFTQTSLLVGEDETHQYVSRLDSSNPNVKEYQKTEYTTTQLAKIAADWVSYELSREIELREWITVSFRHRLWVLTDTNQPIVFSDSKNVSRRNLSSPDKVTIVYPSKKLPR